MSRLQGLLQRPVLSLRGNTVSNNDVGVSPDRDLIESSSNKEVDDEKPQQNAGIIPVVLLRDLVRTYRLGQNRVRALRGISLEVYPGEFVAVTGPSGSGKSTLMNIIGCMDRASSGDYWLNGIPVSKLRSEQQALVRSRHIGFIFQNFNLLS